MIKYLQAAVKKLLFLLISFPSQTTKVICLLLVATLLVAGKTRGGHSKINVLVGLVSEPEYRLFIFVLFSKLMILHSSPALGHTLTAFA